ncbi:MFS transporter [Paenibacillus mesotrionivorans]|uniref:MFS transporter n=1 Tax=Paenibacillus mesotrionivorans TaxID=3160968 RepID=A0ACC7NRV6_9BACL
MSGKPLSQPGGAEPLWTRSFIVLTISYFLMFMCLQMLLSPFPSYVKDRFAPGDVALSLVTSLFALTAIAARFATAALMKRISKTGLLYTSLGISVAATLAYPLADSLGSLLALRMLFGIGFGMGSTVMPTLVSRIIPTRRMGEGIGYFGLSTSLAMSFGPMIGLALLDGFGFGVLTVWGAVAAAAVIPLLAITRAAGVSSQAESSKRSAVEVQRAAGNASGGVRQREEPPSTGLAGRLWLPLTLNTLLSSCYGGILSFLALYGRDIGLANIGLFFLFNALTVLAVRPVSGWLYDTRGHAVVLVPAAMVLVASLGLLSYTHSMVMLMSSALLFGLGYGAVQPTVQAWMLGGSPRSSHGLINSLFYNSIDLGVAVGSMGLGVVAAATSYAVMYRFSAGIMLLFLVLYLAVAVAGGRLRKRLGETELAAPVRTEP